MLGLGVALVVVAALTTWTLHLAGRGKPGGPRPVGEQGRRTRDSTARAGHAPLPRLPDGGPGTGARARAAVPPLPRPVRTGDGTAAVGLALPGVPQGGGLGDG
ncbi:HGxxPAAW family protein [Streptomyces flavovirens]|uniref:HGxxPAAW family protein n=1 Tax=Streptomyces flavovirens TaxID=52258 RepID=UPI003D09D63B